MIETRADVERLTPYCCEATNPRTGRTCGCVVAEVWTSDVAVIRRRCKQCGTWYWLCFRSDGTVDLLD